MEREASQQRERPDLNCILYVRFLLGSHNQGITESLKYVADLNVKLLSGNYRPEGSNDAVSVC